ESANRATRSERCRGELRDRFDDLRPNIGVLGILGVAGQSARRGSASRSLIEDSLNRRPQRLAILHAVAERGRHAMVGENYQIVAATTRQLRHSPDLGDPRVGAPHIGERLLARWPEMVRQLVV